MKLHKQAAKKTENMLETHFRRLRRIERMKSRSQRLEKRCDLLESKIKECKYELDCSLRGMRYDGIKVMTSGVSNEIEDSLMRAASDIERELLRSRKKFIKLECDIDYAISQCEDIEQGLKILSDEQHLILELRYSEGLTHRRIGDRLGRDHSTICREKDKIIEVVAEEFGIN